MSSFLYPSYHKAASDNEIDVATDTFKSILLTSAYTPSKSHIHRSDVESAEVTGTGYTAGGIAQTVVTAFTAGEFTLTTGAVTYTSVTLSGVRYQVTYRDNGTTSADDQLICVVDLVTDRSDLSGSFPISSSIYRNF